VVEAYLIEHILSYKGVFKKREMQYLIDMSDSVDGRSVKMACPYQVSHLHSFFKHQDWSRVSWPDSKADNSYQVSCRVTWVCLQTNCPEKNDKLLMKYSFILQLTRR
jgi:hypothetical protein